MRRSITGPPPKIHGARDILSVRTINVSWTSQFAALPVLSNRLNAASSSRKLNARE
jgi:hypothetical protein